MHRRQTRIGRGLWGGKSGRTKELVRTGNVSHYLYLKGQADGVGKFGVRWTNCAACSTVGEGLTFAPRVLNIDTSVHGGASVVISA